MEHLYNPEQMPEQEIKDTFVARQALVDRLVKRVRSQSEGAGVQHSVIVAPRGMGKTTMLLMLQFAVADTDLNEQWIAIHFPEELYGVSDLADFWLETLAGLEAKTGDIQLQDNITTLRERYQESDTLQEGALALLRGWCRQHDRRLLLLVDNFDQILGQINDEQQTAALRNVLMNEGFLMIMAAAPTFFKEASKYDQPLYNFFKIEHLDRLSFEEVLDLLRRRAKADGLEDFEKILDDNQSRLRVLEYFTGGNVRLVLMLYQVVSQSAVTEVRQGLEKLLDQVTPFFKAKTEDLPAQQRKILDYIARTTGETHEGVSPSEIAKSVRLTAQVVSTQLKRLAEQGYVQSANIRGRSTFYVLSEPLYSLWYQMRFGRNARQKMAWFVNFLKAWYDASELSIENSRLETRIRQLVKAGLADEAHKVLDQQRLIAEAIVDPITLARALKSLVDGYLRLEDKFALTDIAVAFSPSQFDPFTLSALGTAGHLGKKQSEQLRSDVEQCTKLSQQTVDAIDARDFNEALRFAEFQVSIAPQWYGSWHLKAIALKSLNRFDEALQCIKRAIILEPDNSGLLITRGSILYLIGDLHEAELDLSDAILLGTENSLALYMRANILSTQGRYIESIVDYDALVKVDLRDAEVWFERGQVLMQLGKLDEALTSIDQACHIDPTNLIYAATRLEIVATLNNVERLTFAMSQLNEIAVRVAASDELPDLKNLANKLISTIRSMVPIFLSWDALNSSGVTNPLSEAVVSFKFDYKSKDFDSARQKWSHVILELNREENFLVEGQPEVNTKYIWQQILSTELIKIALEGQREFIRDLLKTSHSEDLFFPLARALDYLSSKDETLLEKLTPEMRPIVDEIVAKLDSVQTPKDFTLPNPNKDPNFPV